MESKVYLAYHKDYRLPSSKTLIPYNVHNCELPQNLFSELSMINDILCDTTLHAPYMGVAHYRRMFQTEHFKNYINGIKYDGYEYGKVSRPILNYTDEHHKAITSHFKLDLGGSDILVLDTFKKSRKDALYSLVEIGWLTPRAVYEFFKYISKSLNKKEHDIVFRILRNDTEHYANNIMYASKDVFLTYWFWIMRVIIGYYNHMEDFREHQTPRMYGYFAEYLMKPCIEIHGWKTKKEKSICLK